jgi:hypothetical protein
MRQKVMDKPITSFGFDAKNSIDRPVVSLLNQLCDLHPGIPKLSILRNLLLRLLPQEIERIKKERKAG